MEALKIQRARDDTQCGNETRRSRRHVTRGGSAQAAPSPGPCRGASMLLQLAAREGCKFEKVRERGDASRRDEA